MAPLENRPESRIQDDSQDLCAASAFFRKPETTFRADAPTTRLRTAAARLARDTDGATMIEYSLLTAIMAGAVVTCMTIFGKAMAGMFDSIVQYYTLAQ